MTGKVCSAADAVARFVPDGCRVLAVGGMHLHNNPMALVFELVRQDRHVARLVTSPSASLNADVLIGAGLVSEVATSYVGFEHLGLAPRFRSAAEAGTLKVLDLCEAAVTHGLLAGAGGMPFAVLPQGLELSDVWRANPESYRMIVDPFGQAPVLVVSAIRPEVAIVHAAEADEHGTAWLAGAHFTDRIMAMAAKTVIVQVERVVSTESMSRRPAGSTVPGFLVSAVVEAAGGCLPTSSHGNYPYDEPAIREYLRIARTADGFAEWISRPMPERLAGASAR
ncbi:MAG TPA: CoA-transferase [Candidatus Dormibacteraeota bacterium]|nr:CoA-transferase [Candidatus Dormibacteraeota bacterium]